MKKTDVMKKNVFNLIILDESGSMSCIERQAVSGVNETIQTIRNAAARYPEQQHHVSLVVFNSSRTETLLDAAPVSVARELSASDFRPDDCTPLYDAMGQSLLKLRQRVTADDQVLVTVITDGLENDSHEFDGYRLRSLVAQLRAEGWVFTYIGSNQDVDRVASELSINNRMEWTETAAGTGAMFRKESRSRSRFFEKLHQVMNEELAPEELERNYFEE